MHLMHDASEIEPPSPPHPWICRSSNPLPKQSTSHHCPLPIHFHKVKFHAGKKFADALAIKPITTYFDVADTSIKTAGPEENPFYNVYWLAQEYEEHLIIQKHPSTAKLPTSRLWYLSNYHDALQAHMHSLQKLRISIP